METKQLKVRQLCSLICPFLKNGSLPGPSGSVSKHLQSTYAIPTQWQQATNFYAFLMQDTIQPLELNYDTIPRFALVNIPISSKFRLVYGVDFGSQIIGASPSTISHQYVMISGEGGPELGCPNVLTLPYSIHQPESIATMTVKHFSDKLTEKGSTYS